MKQPTPYRFITPILPQSFKHTLAATAVIGANLACLPAQGAVQLEEIVVTAQKREQSSQDIAAAITAVGSDQLERNNLTNINDLQNLAPSLQIGESFGFAKVMIRGIGTDNPFAGGDPSVAMHIDGVIVGQSSAQFGSLFDIERIEVLRGPQGTLYGRNATGGSINVITHKPSEETEGYARLTAGNYDLIKLEGAVGGSLTDTLQGRLALRSVDRGGYGENIADGSDIDDAEQQSIRGQLRWLASDSVDINLSLEHHEEDDANYIPKFRAASYDPAPLAELEPQPTSGTRASDPRDINSNVDLQNQREQDSYSLEVNWDINETLSFTSLSNYQTFEKIPQADFDMTEVDFYIWSESFDTEQVSEELRLNIDTDRSHAVLGLFYYNEEISSDNRLDLPIVPQAVADVVPELQGCGDSAADNASDNILNTAPEDLCFQFTGTSETEAYALFANYSYDLSDSLVLHLGGRYSYEKREGNTERWTAPGAPNITFADEKSFNEFSPSIKLEWQANDDVMLYAGYSEGFKSGIFLTGQTSPVLDPEIVDAFEAGLKGMFFDRTLQFNAAAFLYDYTDLQQGRSVPAGTSGFTLVYENAASAEIKGLEMEFTWLLGELFTLQGSATYLDAEFDDYVTTDPFDTVFQQLGLIDAEVDLSQQLAGNSMVNAPEYSGNLSLTLDLPLGDSGWQSSSTLTASYKDKVYFSQFNHDELAQDAYTTVDANIVLSSPDDQWTINLWGKNLTDEEIYVGTFILNSSRTNAGFLAPPRTYGVTAAYNF